MSCCIHWVLTQFKSFMFPELSVVVIATRGSFFYYGDCRDMCQNHFALDHSNSSRWFSNFTVPASHPQIFLWDCLCRMMSSVTQWKSGFWGLLIFIDISFRLYTNPVHRSCTLRAEHGDNHCLIFVIGCVGGMRTKRLNANVISFLHIFSENRVSCPILLHGPQTAFHTFHNLSCIWPANNHLGGNIFFLKQPSNLNNGLNVGAFLGIYSSIGNIFYDNNGILSVNEKHGHSQWVNFNVYCRLLLSPLQIIFHTAFWWCVHSIGTH